MPKSGKNRRTTLGLLTFIYLAACLLIWLVESVVGERRWLSAMLVYVPQQVFAAPAPILLLWALIVRNRRLVIWNIAGLLFVTVALLGLNIPSFRSKSIGGVPLRVMTYNIHHASRGAEKVAGVVQSFHPDVLCIQEANADVKSPDPMPSLSKLMEYPYTARYRELATFSRYPIVSQRVHRMPFRTGRVILETTIDAPGNRITVLNVHLATAVTGSAVRSRRRALREYIRHTAMVRARQVDMLLDIERSSSGPLLAMGDMNSPPRGIVYRRLTHRFQDVFHAAGWGFGYSYRSDLPLMRIDYVLAGRDMTVRACRVPRATASDHRPVVADVVVR